MKPAAWFLVSAALHGVLFVVPASHFEVETARVFPVRIVALSQPASRPAPAPKTHRAKKTLATREPPMPPAEKTTTIKPEPAVKTTELAPKEPLRPNAEPKLGASVPEPSAEKIDSLETSFPPLHEPATARNDRPAEVKPKATAEIARVTPTERSGPAVEPLQAAPKREAPTAELQREARYPVQFFAKGENSLSPSRAAVQAATRPVPNLTRETGDLESSGQSERESIREQQHSDLPEPAKYAYNPAPRYPESARREGSHGLVLLSVHIDREGRPDAVEISQSSGVRALDEAAIRSVKDWRFHPARRNGKPVESWVRIPIVFRLEN